MASLERLEVAAVVVVKQLFYGDQSQRSEGEDDLQALHAELARARRLLTPERCRTAAQPAKLAEDGEI
jgi:hypothetical protein